MGSCVEHPAAAAEHGSPASEADLESARERLKRHRTEMAGRVLIPEMWGQESLLKDWVVNVDFDRPTSRGLLTARDALVADYAGRRLQPPAHSRCTTAASS